MGENNALDRAFAADISQIGARKVKSSMDTEWTDEKHRSYLNSIEASFVKQLYSSEFSSNDLLGWLSRTQMHTNSSGSDPKSQSVGQFKVVRRGCWKKLKSERAKNQAENENESNNLSANPWIRHFRSHSTAKEPHLTSEDHMEGNITVAQSYQLINQGHDRGATSLKQPSSSCSHKIHKVSVGSITEVSDQNFEDMEVAREEDLNRRCRNKRARSAVSPITDQVVPSVAAAPDEKTAFLKEIKEEYSKRNLEPQSSVEDQKPSDPQMVGGLCSIQKQKQER